jgi:predicted phosphoribosyltransferase
MRTYADRAEGGRELAARLVVYRDAEAVVYGLPRGGVVTAKAVSEALGLPLDLIIARKIGRPDRPEFGVGAITDDGDVAMSGSETQTIPPDWLEAEKERQLHEARRQRDLYLMDRLPVPVRGKVAILVDDGIATGYTMEAAILSVRRRQPSKIVVAAPVAPPDMAERFRHLADEVVVAEEPSTFYAVGQWYEHFPPVEDRNVLALLRSAAAP